MYASFVFIFVATIFLGVTSSVRAQGEVPRQGLAQVVGATLRVFSNFFKELASPLLYSPSPSSVSTSYMKITSCGDNSSNRYFFIITQAGPICRGYLNDAANPERHEYYASTEVDCKNMVCGNNNGSSDNGDDGTDGGSIGDYGSKYCGTNTRWSGKNCVALSCSAVLGSGGGSDAGEGNNDENSTRNSIRNSNGRGNGVNFCESRMGEGRAGCERDDQCAFCHIERLSYCAPASTFQIECGKIFKRYYVDDIQYGIRIKR